MVESLQFQAGNMFIISRPPLKPSSNDRCQPVDYSNSERALIMMNVSWFYYFGRFIEFFDTFFFVLRKKFRQVSFLHVAHHAVMPMFMWPFVRLDTSFFKMILLKLMITSQVHARRSLYVCWSLKLTW